MVAQELFSVVALRSFCDLSPAFFAACAFDSDARLSSPISIQKNSAEIVFDENVEAIVVVRPFPYESSEKDMEIAAECSERGVGFVVLDESVKECIVVVSFSKKALVSLSSDECASILSKNGPLSRIFDGYEERPGQIALVRDISEAFNNLSVGVFEAGTGVGKSFAYLIPSILWAKRNHEKVVISTGTINLQQQLFEKDIPLAQKVVGEDFSAVIVKGRANFICLRRLHELSEERELFSEDTVQFDNLFSFAQKSLTGSKSDLSFKVREGLWQRVCSESDACLGVRCEFFDKCFVMKMRRKASESDILIVNHHLLFADIASRLDGAGFSSAAVLPPYKRIVFDEAHGIEQAATSFFSLCAHRFSIFKQLNLLFKKNRTSAHGFLFTLSALSQGEDKTAHVEIIIEEIKEQFKNLEVLADSFLKNKMSVRISDENDLEFKAVCSQMELVCNKLSSICSLIRSIMDKIDSEDLDEAVVWEVRAVLKNLDSFVSLFASFSEREKYPDKVFWIERKRLSQSLSENALPFYIQFFQTPLDISSMMNEGVFSPMDSVVCTSATLSVAGGFDFWENRVGISCIDEKNVVRSSVASPFPYKKNALLAIPSDAPFPDREDFQDFVEKALCSLVKNARGRTLVLFTSYEMLKKTAEGVLDFVCKAGIKLLKQGDDDRFRLLKEFSSNGKNVLFATDSFWEGVDVPGKMLSQVVIVKLPFSVPSDPVFAARSEIVEKNGGNAFMELSVPEAVIRFRQGFGRLIRRGDDRGAVVVLDRRLMEKRYGTIFLQSLPKTAVAYKNLDLLINEISHYL